MSYCSSPPNFDTKYTTFFLGTLYSYMPVFCETLQGSQIGTLFNGIRCHVPLKGKFERNNGVGQTAE